MKSQQTLITLFTTAVIAILNPSQSAAADSADQLLACRIAAEKQYASAAIEFRRLAISSTDSERAGYYWGAAYMYSKAEKSELALKMLDYADETAADEAPNLLLRIDCAINAGHYEEAEFYAASLAESSNADLQRMAGLRQLKLNLLGGKQKEVTEQLPQLDQPVKTAVSAYLSGSDKSPLIGGLLGTVPGLGYAYAGEYANALRSLILNSIFIYGMVETADHDNWGAFAVITFFEITWYSGSIYGGIDAADRYNRRRLSACLQVIDSHSAYRPELSRLPAIAIKYRF